MKTTGAGLAVIAVGAILAFAVRSSPSGFNINIAGWVLIIVGVLGILLPSHTRGWIGQRVVRRRYTAPGVPPQRPPVQGYVAEIPGTARLQAGVSPAPQIHDRGEHSVGQAYPSVIDSERPPASEVVEDVYEEPS